MKILKVELQNINSLKSDTPIVIDFESDTFNDVGLYVITGSTGSGKTTILDAITIALYHSVPRLNKSKAGLNDVVSYGANDALSRVTFENKNNIYEAQWTLRVMSKTGKTLGKPDEQVRLKNLTSGEIIAEKKKDFNTKIIEITQLNYNQFLRSVMLAQGEFASFLSAKPSEKGTLLEQITGEEIYRKIGESLNNRLFEERRKKKEIELKINNEDVLTEEDRKLLTQELDTIKSDRKKIEIDLSEIELVINWHKKNRELTKTKDELKLEIENLELFRKENEDKLEKLKLHEEATPFNDILKNIKRIDGEISNKQKQLIDLEIKIKLTEESITSSKSDNDLLKESYLNIKGENNQWQEKLQKIAELDIIIKNNKENREKFDGQIKDLKELVTSINSNIEIVTNNKKTNIELKAELENYLSTNKSILKISDFVNGWSTKFAELKGLAERLNKENTTVDSIQKELETTRINYKVEEGKLNEEELLLSTQNNEIVELSKKLDDKNLDEALEKQDKLNSEKQSWNDLKRISAEYVKLSESLKTIKQKEINLIKEIEELSKLKLLQKKEVEKSKISLDDAKKILSLQRTIQSFDEEREKLKHGKPCGLCGSTVHPYVEDYEGTKIDKSENEVSIRENKLEENQVILNENKIEIAEKRSTLNQIKLNIITTENSISLLEIEYQKLDLKCEISDVKTANKEYIEIVKQLDFLKITITKIQDLRKLKETKTTEIKELEQKVNNIRLNKSNLEATGKALKTDIENRKEEIETLTKNISYKQKILKAELSNLDLELPDISNYISFIVNLQTRIKSYQDKKDDLTTINHSIETLIKEVDNYNKNLLEKEKEIIKLRGDISKANNELELISNKRHNILPMNVSIEEKRKELKLSLEKVSDLFDKSTRKLQELEKKLEAEKSSKKGFSEQITTLKKDLINLEEKLVKALSESVFNTKEEIEKSILSEDLQNSYSKIRKYINESDIATKTKGEGITRTEEFLGANKISDIDEREASTVHKELKSKEKNLIERKGNIDQQIFKDNEIRERNKKVFEEIDTQAAVLKKWDTLHSLLGGSKDAFNTYVQRLTLEGLIALSNQHLYKLNKRYSLEINKTFKAGEELNFSLVDHYQTDRLRPVDTTSGGEKFLISLSLALGLSDLASNNVSIDSLFIDEGFGTLDSNMLETVISTLETLQSQGKMIGVISHVENLKERISTQIQIHKNSNGVSSVEIV